MELSHCMVRLSLKAFFAGQKYQNRKKKQNYDVYVLRIERLSQMNLAYDYIFRFSLKFILLK